MKLKKCHVRPAVRTQRLVVRLLHVCTEGVQKNFVFARLQISLGCMCSGHSYLELRMTISQAMMVSDQNARTPVSYSFSNEK